MHPRTPVLPFLLALCALVGCQTLYYSTWEKLGKEKRHLLRDNVADAQQAQQKASEEFKDALTQVQEIYGFEGGDLEAMYDRLQDDYDACAYRAQAVEERIETVEQIAGDLFAEWEAEIDQMANQKLKSASRESLIDTRHRYARLHRAMEKARARMTPALNHLRDYVLYLKHNLNAQAVGTLGSEVDSIQAEVENLIADISDSIQEADAFLKTLE